MANNIQTKALDGSNYDCFLITIQDKLKMEVIYDAPSDFDYIKRVEMIPAKAGLLEQVSVELKVGTTSYIHGGTPATKFAYDCAAPDGLRGFVFEITGLRDFVIPTKGKTISLYLVASSPNLGDVNIIIEYAKYSHTREK